MLAATMTKQPLLAITEQQGEELGAALVDITEHYGLAASREFMLWAKLGAACAMIYGPKIFFVMNQPKKPPVNSDVSNVTPLNAGLNFGGA